MTPHDPDRDSDSGADAPNLPHPTSPDPKASPLALTVGAPAPSEIILSTPGGFAMALPAVIANAGERARRATFEFFTARIANDHTRKAYARAVERFCGWCDAHRIALPDLDPPKVSGYLHGLQDRVSVASVKLTASAIRHWLDFLTERGALDHNPSLSVRTARLVVKEGKTPVLSREQARAFFAVLDAAADTRDLIALRDRALFGIMLFGFVRVGAAVRMKVVEFEDAGEFAQLVLHEKGGNERRIPCHHQARAYLRAYVAAAGFKPQATVPLFQTAPGKKPALSGRALTGGDAWEAVKRWCDRAGVPLNICNHSFRASGITIHQENGGRLEEAQDLAGHADARTTRLYVRKNRVTAQAEVERVQL